MYMIYVQQSAVAHYVKWLYINYIGWLNWLYWLIERQMKEKERRLKQRELKLEQQRQHQEERIKKAMERANAEPRKKVWLWNNIYIVFYFTYLNMLNVYTDLCVCSFNRRWWCTNILCFYVHFMLHVTKKCL